MLRFRISTFLSALVLVILAGEVPLAGQADIYLKQKRHTSARKMMGQSIPATDEINEIWMTTDKGRFDVGEHVSTIIRIDQKKIYLLQHDQKKVTEIPIGGLEDILNSTLGGEEGREKLSEKDNQNRDGFMKKMMEMEARVTETGETRRIRDWNCRKYLLEMNTGVGKTTSEIWATEDIKADYSLYRQLSNSLMVKNPAMTQMMNEMKKIKGIPVLTHSTTQMMGQEVKITEELLEAVNKQVPPELFEVPAGYQKNR